MITVYQCRSWTDPPVPAPVIPVTPFLPLRTGSATGEWLAEPCDLYAEPIDAANPIHLALALAAHQGDALVWLDFPLAGQRINLLVSAWGVTVLGSTWGYTGTFMVLGGQWWIRVGEYQVPWHQHTSMQDPSTRLLTDITKVRQWLRGVVPVYGVLVLDSGTSVRVDRRLWQYPPYSPQDIAMIPSIALGVTLTDLFSIGENPPCNPDRIMIALDAIGSIVAMH